MSANDKFTELESRILRTIELIRTTRKEKETLERELAAARNQIGRLEREVSELKNDRDLVRDKIESLLDTLSEFTEESLV